MGAIESGFIGQSVRRKEDARFLMGAGCEQAQGFLFAKPMPAEEFANLFLQSFAEAESGNNSARR